jgi:hypothetical protein
LYQHRPWINEPEEDTPENRQTASLVGFVIILLLLIMGLFLVQQLRTSSAMQDCLLAGRRNCELLVHIGH